MKILVVRFSSIGDIVLTSGVVRCLKTQLNAELHFLTKEAYGPLISANPHIDKVYLLKDQLSALYPSLREEQYDFIVDLHRNLRSRRLRSALRKPGRSFPKLNWEKWLLTTFKIDKLPNIHLVDRYFEATQPLDIRNDGLGLDFFIPEKDYLPAPAFHPLLKGSFLALVIGAKYSTKQYPVEKVLALCRNMDYPTVLIGGETERENGIWIADQAGDHVVNACGELDLFGSASLIDQAALVISNDTGMMHIAAARKKPLLSIWGNTVPKLGMTPYYGKYDIWQKRFEAPPLSCRPCSKIGYSKCPKGHFKCMHLIDPSNILETIQQFLSPSSH